MSGLEGPPHSGPDSKGLVTDTVHPEQVRGPVLPGGIGYPSAKREIFLRRETKVSPKHERVSTKGIREVSHPDALVSAE